MLTFTFCIVSGWKSFLGNRVDITILELGKVQHAFSVKALRDRASLSCCDLRSFVPVWIRMWLGEPRWDSERIFIAASVWTPKFNHLVSRKIYFLISEFSIWPISNIIPAFAVSLCDPMSPSGCAVWQSGSDCSGWERGSSCWVFWERFTAVSGFKASDSLKEVTCFFRSSSALSLSLSSSVRETSRILWFSLSSCSSSRTSFIEVSSFLWLSLGLALSPVLILLFL